MRGWARSLGTGAALALLVAAVALGRAGQRGADVSTLAAASNVGPRGLAAARELLGAAGASVTRRGPGDPTVPGVAVIVVAAPGAQLTAGDASALVDEASRGAHVVIAIGGVPQPALASTLGVELAPGSAPRLARGLAPHPLVGDLKLPARAAALSPRRPGALAVSGDRGWASAVSFPVGRGEVLLLSGPEPLENAHLLEGDAATFVLRLGALGPVVLDERFLAPPLPAPHGRRALLLLCSQLLLAGAALVVARGRRLGAIRPPPPGAGRTARDYLGSLAALYRRAGAEQELAQEAWRALRRRLERRWAVPARLADAQAARRVAARSREASLALARGSAALAGGGEGVLLRVTRAAADAERAMGGRERVR